MDTIKSENPKPHLQPSRWRESSPRLLGYFSRSWLILLAIVALASTARAHLIVGIGDCNCTTLTFELNGWWGRPLVATLDGIVLDDVVFDQTTNPQILTASRPANLAGGTHLLVITQVAPDGVLLTASADVSICDCAEPVDSGRMTGGGSIISSLYGRVTHGFELHCDVNSEPNNLEINWGRGNKFHLEELTFAECSDDPAIAPAPPKAGFDTFVGEGTGRYNGQAGATAKWTFTDAGEPGKKDWASIVIKDSNGNVVLSVQGYLNSGNHQAHDN